MGERFIDRVYEDPAMNRMLCFVREILQPVDKLSKTGRAYPFRSRFEHTTRVIEWALRINEQEKADAEIITVAGIFHDVGYIFGGEGHAKNSEKVFIDYVKEHGLFGWEQQGRQEQQGQQGSHNQQGQQGSQEQPYQKIAAVISTHSDKKVRDKQFSKEQIILMDADLLDEAGAMSVLWSCFTVAGQEAFNFRNTLAEIQKGYQRLQEDAELFRTDSGRSFHNQMQAYVGEFIQNLKYELNLR